MKFSENAYQMLKVTAVVVVLAEDRVRGEIIEGVVHPPHVPLHAEAEAAHMRGPRDHGPGRRLLGDRLDVGKGAVDLAVQAPEEIDGIDVLPAAVLVRDPLALLARIVEVEHGRNRVDPEPVGVVLVEPEERARDQEVPDLVPAVVEDVARPLGVKSLLRVLVLVEVRAVEIHETVRVARKVRRHPVEDHADPLLVQAVDQIHEILRRAVPARGREITRDLVAPGAVEGMLHHGHELHVGEARVLEVLRKIGGHLAVGERTVVLLRHPSPGADVELVHGIGRLERIPRVPVLHPFVVAPLVREVPDHGGGAGRRLPGKREGIALFALVSAVTGHDDDTCTARPGRRRG